MIAGRYNALKSSLGTSACAMRFMKTDASEWIDRDWHRFSSDGLKVEQLLCNELRKVAKQVAQPLHSKPKVMIGQQVTYSLHNKLNTRGQHVW